jgi:mono/diheme cytochrome c family protein
MVVRAILWLFIVVCLDSVVTGADANPEPSAAERGYRFLVDKAYLPPDFDQQTFDDVWQKWPEPLRSEAEKASADERRRMAFERYGLTPRPDDPTKPLQYVVDAKGNWTMNCFACHGGQVHGRVVPGLPNSMYALQTLTDETRSIKLDQGKQLTRMDVGSLVVPLGSTNGTTNAVMFGVALMAFRDADLNVLSRPAVPKMTHHDMDAPAWWHFKRKQQLYIDGFAGKGHRGLMQFTMVKQNGPEKFREWEDDFRDIYAYISSIEPPKYPFPVDQKLAEEGRTVFNRVCASCHGTYGENGIYPERRIAIDRIGTDRVRLDALSANQRESYGKSWFAEYGGKRNVNQPNGYVAPPLDGIWASAPYFHNGSVPTLHHVLFPDQRPKVWRRTSVAGYDEKLVGLEVEPLNEMPRTSLADWERRTYFNTSAFGKSAAGHDFPSALSEDARRAVLEYLKTL